MTIYKCNLTIKSGIDGYCVGTFCNHVTYDNVLFQIQYFDKLICSTVSLIMCLQSENVINGSLVNFAASDLLSPAIYKNIFFRDYLCIENTMSTSYSHNLSSLKAHRLRFYSIQQFVIILSKNIFTALGSMTISYSLLPYFVS